MPAAKPRHSLDELAHLAGIISERQVRPVLRPEDYGKFVATDVETGGYEMDEDNYAAVARLRSRKPAVETWLMCAGYPTTYRIGVVRPPR